MPPDQFELEQKAQEAYVAIMQDMRQLRSAFEAAGVRVPDRVLRFLQGEPAPSSEASQSSSPRAIIPPPVAPPRPPEASQHWLWLPIDQMTPTGLVRGILRAAAHPLTPKMLIEQLRELRDNINPGSIANIGTRLEQQGSISRTEAGWQLAPNANAPVLYSGNAWGSEELFESYELAAQRRNCIFHVLRVYEDGLQPMQLVKALEGCTWVHASVTKDLIKTDLQTLDQEGRAKRIGNSGKWRAVAA